MPKFWQSIEKSARLNEAISILGASEVKEARPDGLTGEDCYALLLSSKVCTSIPMAKNTVKELLWAGRLSLEDGLYSVTRVRAKQKEEDPKAILDRMANAKSGSVDKSHVTFGATPE